MRGRIVARIINMHKCPVNNGYGLQEVGEHLAEVVAVLERHVGGEDDVGLNEELVSRVVGAQVLDLADGGGEAHCEVEEEVALVRMGGEAGEVADVEGRGLGPVEDDDEGEEETAEGVEPPDATVESNCEASSVPVLNRGR